MNTKDALIEAYLRGSAWNPDPEFANLLNLDLGRVQAMDGTEADAKLLLRSRQLSDINYDTLVRAYHQREPEYDGGFGAATEALINLPRCPLPDNPPPPNARFHYDDPDLQAAVESMQAAAAQPAFVGSYWRGCDPQNPGVHSLVIGIDVTRAPKNYLANQDKILEARRKCAAEIGVSVRYVINPSSMSGLQQYQVFSPGRGSVIGTNYFPQSNSCGKIPNGFLNSNYDPSNWELHANLGVHEGEGHGFGFNHTRGGIMNASIVLVSPVSWKGDPGWSQVIRYYPGKPLAAPIPDPGPGPTPIPLPGSLKLPITITDADGKRYGLHPFTEV